MWSFENRILLFVLIIHGLLICASNGRCGVSTAVRSRIIGGTDTSKGTWPWQAAITYKDIYFCGGAILNPTTVITAAHCVEFLQPSILTVRAGVHNRTFPKDEQKINVSSFKMHEKYDSTQYSYDIAIIKLQRPIKFNKYASAICLPSTNEIVKVGSQCFVTGFGFNTIKEDKQPEILQQLKLKVIDNTVCQQKNGKFANVTADMVCGEKVDNHTTINRLICGGDSGGPLMCMSSTTRSWKLHGIVNWASPLCHSSKSHSVFARASYHLKWIKANM